MDIKEFKAITHEEIHHHPWEHARFEVVFSNMKRFMKKKEPVIVDIGCGDIFFLKQLAKKRTDAKLIGVDIEFTDEMISEFSGQSTIQLYKSAENVPSVPADIVLLLDVIEHIEDDYAFLNDLLKAGFISKDTIFIITVPAFQKLFVVRDEWLGHYRRYNLGMLKKLANAQKLSILDLKYFFTSLYFARSAQNAMEKIKKPDINQITGIGNYKKKPIFDYLFKTILLGDYYIGDFVSKTGLKLPGLSCMAVLTKREL
jgi:2-polyprenyl-3-methyl-5-hydroxy-6-metoxy-1,4-benzoquinol methylase